MVKSYRKGGGTKGWNEGEQGRRVKVREVVHIRVLLEEKGFWRGMEEVEEGVIGRVEGRWERREWREGEGERGAGGRYTYSSAC